MLTIQCADERLNTPAAILGQLACAQSIKERLSTIDIRKGLTQNVSKTNAKLEHLQSQAHSVTQVYA